MDKSSFFKYFPVPRYLQLPAVGFDVSDGSVKFIELLRQDGGVKVGRYGRRAFGEDLVGMLTKIQKEFCLHSVNVSIPEEEAFFTRIRLPFIKPEEIRGAIELQIEEYIPYPAEDVEFDYDILKSDPRQGGYIEVNVSALPKKILKNYLDIFKQANLEPVSLMIEADATSKSAVPSEEKDVVMVINIGRVNTVLSIISNGAVWFSYTFKFGGDLLVKRLQETLRVSQESAEKIKNERGLINSVSNQEVFGCLLPMVSSIRDETRRHLRYWSESRGEFLMAKDANDISKIILCGSQSIIPGLDSYLSTALGLKATLANPWKNILSFDDYIPPINYKSSLEYTTAIGLAMSNLK